MKFKYLVFTALSFSLVGTQVYAKTSSLCEKGTAFKKTLRSLNGVLCSIKPIAAWAEKNCSSVPDYKDSKCHTNAVKTLGGTNPGSIIKESSGIEKSVKDILRLSKVKFSDKELQLMKQAGEEVPPPPPTDLPPPLPIVVK